MILRLVSILALTAPLFAQFTQAVLPENAEQKVSDHVQAIVAFPNIAIVTGTRATLVVDTGMGPRNGQIITRYVQRLSRAPLLYVTTTHYHPEHAGGIDGFPQNAILVRNRPQQEEMDANGQRMMDLFASRSEQNKELLGGAKLRTPDVIYDDEMKLDLGGVTVRLLSWGGGHTKGDQLIFVEPDSVLISGDIVENKLTPTMPEGATPRGWLKLLDRIETLHPRLVVPDHGALGDGSLVQQEKSFLSDLQAKALEYKKQGIDEAEAGKRVTADMKAKYTDWPNLNGVPNVVRRVYAENP